VAEAVAEAVASSGSGARGHKTTWNFLSHIKWREIIHWTRIIQPWLNYHSCCRRIQMCLHRQPHKVVTRTEQNIPQSPLLRVVLTTLSHYTVRMCDQKMGHFLQWSNPGHREINR